LKVLLVANYAPDAQQSMLRFAAMMQRELTARGHAVSVIAPRAILFPNVRRTDGIWKWIGYLNKFVLFIPALRRAARRADVVHVCDHSNAMYGSWLRDRAHLVTCHDVIAIRAAHGLDHTWHTGMTGRVFQNLILRGLSRAQYVVCVSQLTHDQLLELQPAISSRSVVIHNALNFDFHPAPQQAVSAARLAAGIGDAPYFIHVGSSLRRKNRVHLVSVLAALQCRIPDLPHRLVLVGSPPDDDISRLLRELGLGSRVIALGQVDNERLRALYTGATALLFPSLSEGFGWPIIEAQACGCPAIVSDLRPMTDIGGEAALRIDPLDADAAAMTIASALPELHKRRDASLLNAALFSSGAMLDAYEHTYRQLVATA
jgi:glycosyltransferase involved in cell wall biosynthesis